MSELTTTKRKYVRIDQSTWAEIEGLWEIGDTTLLDLEARYGVSRRTLQSHFAKRGTVKGAQAAQLATAVKQQVFSQNLVDEDLMLTRAKETREAAYENARVVENLIMGQLAAAQQDPSQALRAASALKALSLAAAGLERLHSLKWRALGLDRGSALSDELPTLIFEDLTAAEITAIQQGPEDDDFEELPSAESTDADDNEVIVIDCSDIHDGEGPTVNPVPQKGPRLVRGAA